MQKDTAAPYFEILHISIDLKDPHEKKGVICKDPEVNSNFQEVFYFLKIRVYFP